MTSVSTKPLYIVGGRLNPEVTRGDFVRPYDGGPVARFVGRTPRGVDWAVYLDKPSAPETYRAMCARFDRLFGEVN
jgi:hypothetical protein